MAGARGQLEELRHPIPNPPALEPPAEWAELRQRCPVAAVRLPSGDRAALVTRYADVKQVLSDPRFGRRLSAPDAARLTDTESGGVFNNDMARQIPDSGEEHQAWRQRDVPTPTTPSSRTTARR